MKLFMHIKNTDVAADFRRVTRTKMGRKIKVEWVNVANPKNVYPCNFSEEIFIRDVDMKNWKPIYVERKGKLVHVKPKLDDLGSA